MDRYEEALERARAGKPLDEVFPELKESEDERIRKEMIDFIQWAEDRGTTRHDYHQAKRPAVWIAYLEKQKEQKHAEWSEFDEDCLKRAIWYVENPAPSVVKDTNLALWLKSLRPQPHWKPSKEQMWALDVALENFYNQNDRAALESLRTDLQKLLSL